MRKRLALGLALALAIALGLGAWALLGNRQAPGRPGGRASAALQALGVFKNAAFGSEDGPDHGLARWQSPIRLSLAGSYTPEDEAWALAFMKELNERVEGFPGIRRAEGAADISVTYAPLTELPRCVDGYLPGNQGYFSYWQEDFRMTRAQIAIASDSTSQRQRNHLFMEELVGALGLAKDIDGYPESIIYKPWTETQQLSDLDWRMLNYLYHPRLRPGMSASQADAALRPLLEAAP